MRLLMMSLGLTALILSPTVSYAGRSLTQTVMAIQNVYWMISNSSTIPQTVDVTVTSMGGTITNSSALSYGVNVTCPNSTTCQLIPSLRVIPAGGFVGMSVVSGSNAIRIKIDVAENAGALWLQGHNQITSGSHMIWPINFMQHYF